MTDSQLITVSHIQTSKPNNDSMVAAWLDNKFGMSSSSNTIRAYTVAMADFRSYLAAHKLDIDSDVKALRIAVQGYISEKAWKPATKNQRLAILSSFYTYANKRDLLHGNPVLDDMRAKVETFSTVRYVNNVAEKLKVIDKTVLDGMRDYAILYLVLITGRRLAEIASLDISDLEYNGDEVGIIFRRTKGNKTARNIFDLEDMKPITDYLTALHSTWKHLKDTPLFLSFSHNSKQKRLSTRSLETICYKHIGVSFHTLRHTFAKDMLNAGASVVSIQEQLGHASLAITQKYLTSLNSGKNAHSKAITSKYR